MKRYSQHQIKALLDKFMDGQTTVEEEALLAEYFRSSDVPAEWEGGSLHHRRHRGYRRAAPAGIHYDRARNAPCCFQ